MMPRWQTMQRDFAEIPVLELEDELRILVLVVLIANVGLGKECPENSYS